MQRRAMPRRKIRQQLEPLDGVKVRDVEVVMAVNQLGDDGLHHLGTIKLRGHDVVLEDKE